MEQAQYWMWMKRRELLKSHISQTPMNSFSDSWEEKAFAEDTAGSPGGCVWPPRSYSCSFCKREFKSAQALGGHMNVHRRDRARLKQSLSPDNEVLHQQNHNQNSLNSLEPKCPTEICSPDYNLDHNTYASNLVASSTLSPTRVSALSTQENISENTLVSPDSSSLVQEKHKSSAYAYTSYSSGSVMKTFLNIIDSKPEVERNPREEDSISIGHGDHVETNLSVGLNSFFCRDRPTGSCGGDEAVSCKRTKTAVTTLPFFVPNDKYALHMEVIGFRSSSKENLDLELRLGNPPKVK